MKYSFFSISLLLLVFFSPAKGQVYGKYATDGKPDFFQFNSDSTFRYEFRSFHSFRFSEGEWSIDKSGKYLILNSYKQDAEPVIGMHECSITSKQDSTATNSISFNFTTSGRFNPHDFKCEIVINDTIYDVIKNGILSTTGEKITDSYNNINPRNFWRTYFRCDSLNMLNSVRVNVPIKTIYFQFVFSPLQPTTDIFTNNIILTRVFNPKNNYCKIRFRAALADSLFFYRVFSNEKIKIKRKKIGVFIRNRKKWETLMKVPDCTEVFMTR